MERIINEVTEKLNREFNNFFLREQTDIAAAESYFGKCIAAATLELMQAYYEQQDQQLRADKARRKQAGLMVERLGDKREILTLLGLLEYRRTYYKKASGGYEHPVDQIAGVDAYERVSGSVGLSLVEASCEMSYAKASEYVTDGHVSRQTVMNKIRSANPQQEAFERQAVPELHVDADEDHVNLQSGKNTIVPLVSVYEGIEHCGKRGVCKNVFHISEYGSSIESLWEKVSDEIERRYDLGITIDADENIRIGSLTSFSHITRDPIIQKYINVLGEAVDMVGGPQIRNIGTIGGNTCNGVTSADSASTLHAWEAIVELFGKNGVRRLPIRDFYIKAGQVDIRVEDGEIQTAILIPKTSYENTFGHYIKYAMRNAMDIATLGCSVNVRLSPDKKTIERARIAYGVAGPVPMRAPHAEAVANGQPISKALIDAFGLAVLEDINPRDSWRASKAFRSHIAVEMAKRCLFESVRKAGGEL